MNKTPLLLTFTMTMFALFILACSGKEEYEAELAMQSDAMAIVNYYYPRRIVLSDTPREPILVLPDLVSGKARHGALILGNSADSVISVLLDESVGGGPSLIYIDRNNNEDLTDDGEPGWDDEQQNVRTKEVLVDVLYAGADAAVPYPIIFYRYTDRHPELIVAYRNGYREGQILLQDSTYRVGVFDDDLDGLFSGSGTIVVDLNRDGDLDGRTDSEENFSLHEPFSVRGVAYHVKSLSPSGERLVVSRVDTTVWPKSILQAGAPAPQFQSTTVSGKPVDLAELRNHVVLLDFGATWCKPWETELANLRRVYSRYHSQGFEIISVSLDYDLDALKQLLTKEEIPWPQIATGQGWEQSLVTLYSVEAIPNNFLLDRQGIIRYKNVYGSGLRSKVHELLTEAEPAD